MVLRQGVKILMETEKSSYKQKIAGEASFWDKKVEEQLAIGMIPDIRRAVKRKKVVAFYDDPEIERIMRGDVRTFIIQKACETKGRALDLGCGVGWLSLELARNGMNVEGIDISEKRIQVAKDYLEIAPEKEKFGSINYKVADLNKIILEECAYQTVVVWDALHHIPEIERLIKEIRKALKPGGNFLVLDSIGSSKLGSLLSKVLYLLLPTKKSYLEKIMLVPKYLKTKILRQQTSIEESSPFEHVTEIEMVNIIKKHFAIKTMRTLLAFSMPLAPSLKVREPLKYKLVSFVKLLDDFLIRMRILRGDQVFIWAKKEEN